MSKLNEDLDKFIVNWFMRLQLDKEFDELSTEIQVKQKNHSISEKCEKSFSLTVVIYPKLLYPDEGVQFTSRHPLKQFIFRVGSEKNLFFRSSVSCVELLINILENLSTLMCMQRKDSECLKLG